MPSPHTIGQSISQRRMNGLYRSEASWYKHWGSPICLRQMEQSMRHILEWLNSYASLGKSLKFVEPQFSCLWTGYPFQEAFVRSTDNSSHGFSRGPGCRGVSLGSCRLFCCQLKRTAPTHLLRTPLEQDSGLVALAASAVMSFSVGINRKDQQPSGVREAGKEKALDSASPAQLPSSFAAVWHNEACYLGHRQACCIPTHGPCCHLCSPNVFHLLA